MNERIKKLETLSALQDETIRQLSEELYRQQQDHTRMKQQITRLQQQIEDLQEPGQIGGNERPPHY